MNREEFELYQVEAFESYVDLVTPDYDIYVEYYQFVLRNLQRVNVSFNDIIDTIADDPEMFDEILEGGDVVDLFYISYVCSSVNKDIQLSYHLSKLFIRQMLYWGYVVDELSANMILNAIAMNHPETLKFITLGHALQHLVVNDDCDYLPFTNQYMSSLNLISKNLSTLQLCKILAKYNITPPLTALLGVKHSTSDKLKSISYFQYDFTKQEKLHVNKLMVEHQDPKIHIHQLPDITFRFLN